MRKNACMLENPISANQMYAPIARGKMVKSKKYNLWIEKNKRTNGSDRKFSN